MSGRFEITGIKAEDATELAAIHIAARRAEMPYLPELHTEDEIREWFSRRVQETPDSFRVARNAGRPVGYIFLDEDQLDDLYVLPDWWRLGIGSALLATAKSLSPERLELSTFQQNMRARAFYEARGFREVGRTDGKNEEGVPDVQYEWAQTPTVVSPAAKSISA
jgi:GNAT superfamily N-acetyltransferase